MLPECQIENSASSCISPDFCFICPVNIMKLHFRKTLRQILFTESIVLTPNVYIHVPIQYKAIIYIEDRSLFKLDPCKAFCFVKKYGSQYLGKKIKLAYIHWINIDAAPWVEENHTINLSDKNKVRLSSSGSYCFDIVNYPRLISNFPDKMQISVADIRKKVCAAISNIVIQTATDNIGAEDTYDTKKIIEEIKACFDDELLLSSIGIRIVSFTMTDLTFNDMTEEKSELVLTAQNN